MLIEKLERLDLKRSFFKKALCLLLIVLFIIPGVPTVSAYDDDAKEYNGLLYEESWWDEGITIVGYTDSLPSTVNIPERIEGNNVTEIGNEAFYGCSKITSVSIPKTVTGIGSYAFYGCSSLNKVTFANGSQCQSIGYYAFKGCASLTSITLPSSLLYINESAFEGTGLNNDIAIPASLTDLGENAFADTSIKSFTVASGNKTYSSQNGVLFNKDKSTLIAYPIGNTAKEYNVPSTVTEISYSSFKGANSLSKVTLPEKIKYIRSYAFNDAENLEEISIPSASKVEVFGTSTIEGTAYFNNNSNWSQDVLYLNNIAVKAKATVKSDYQLTSNTTCIADNAFEDCKNISGNIFNKLTNNVYIGNYSFKNCTGINNLSLNNNIIYKSTSFSGCNSIETLYFNTKTVYGMHNLKKLRSVSLGDAVEKVGSFDGCPNLTDFHIGKSVVDLNSKMFKYSDNVKNITVSKDNKNIYIENGVIYIKYNREETRLEYNEETDEEITYTVDVSGTKLFRVINDTLGTSFSIPDNITDIIYCAFMNAKSLESITFPEQLRDIERAAFRGLGEQKTLYYNSINYTDFVEIPCETLIVGKNVKELPGFERGFDWISVNNENTTFDSRNNCNAIIKKDNNMLLFASNNTFIPDGVETINSEAFLGCDNLKNITIPSSVTSMDSYRYYDDDAEKFIYNTKIGSYESGLFSGFEKINNINVDSGNRYFSSDENGVLFNKDKSILLQYPSAKTGSYRVPNTVKEIFDESFSNSVITSVTIPNTVIEIGNSAFYQCSKLSSITFGSKSNLEMIDRDAFAYCAITEFTIPASVTNMDGEYNYISEWDDEAEDWIEKREPKYGGYDSVFYGCKNLSKVIVESGNEYYSVDSNGVLFNKNKSELFQYPSGKSGSYTIPGTVKSINDASFSGSVITSVFIPASVKEIGENAFAHCEKLSSVTFASGSSLEVIKSRAFMCSGITEITIPASIVNMNGNYDYTSEWDEETEDWIYFEKPECGGYNDVFFGCKNLNRIIVASENNYYSSDSNGVLFNKDKSKLLQYPSGKSGSYIVPDTVKTICENAFYNSSNLTEITIPKNVTEFYDCGIGFNYDYNYYDRILGLIIYCYTDSYAKSYAEYYGIDYVLLDAQPEEFTVTYNANGGTNTPSPQTKKHDIDLNLSNVAPIREGYVFLGWSEDKDATSAQYKSGDVYTRNADITLYAIWAAKNYIVTFNANGGSCSTASKTVTYNSTYGTLPTPSWSGYKFIGWYTAASGGSKIESSTKVTIADNQALYAHWSADTYTISFDANGGSGAPEAQIKTHDVALTLSSTVPVREGYKFLGWAEISTATAAQYASGAKFTKNTATTLYAVWSPIYCYLQQYFFRNCFAVAKRLALRNIG